MNGGLHRAHQETLLEKNGRHDALSPIERFDSLKDSRIVILAKQLRLAGRTLANIAFHARDDLVPT